MKIECGIHGWGFAIPRRRLPNAATLEAWERPDAPGSRAVAGHDEDSLTLAAEAALNAADGFDPGSIGGLVFASTTAPLAEKSCAVVLGDVVGLDPGSRFVDIGGSLGAGIEALSAACDIVASGSSKYVLVAVADTRLAKPGAPDEFLFGHAGVALLVGPADGAVASIAGTARYATSQIDKWRTADSRFPASGDVRFAREGAFAGPTQAVLKEILAETGWEPPTIAKVVPYSPDVKSASRVLSKNGFDLKTQYWDLASAKVGLTGAPHTLLMLCAALEESAAGEKVLALGYGDGADALALEVLRDPPGGAFKVALAPGYDISYNKHLSLSNLLAGSVSAEGGFTSEIMEERNKSLWFSLRARKCARCECILTLPLPACPTCREAEEFDMVRLSRNGTVFAFTHEHYFPTPEPPLGMAAVDLDDGGRLTLQVADENVPVKVRDRVELVFRKLHDAGGRPNYFWKCRAKAEEEVGDAG